MISTRGPVTLIGSGLVGSLLGIFLAKRGYDVEILERRSDPRREKVNSGRSINLALSRRGLNALSQMGLEQAVLDQAIPMYGRMIHPVSGGTTFQRYGKNDSEFISSISRSNLNNLLMASAEETGQVKFCFQQEVTGIDFNRKSLQLFDKSTGETRDHCYQRVVGTDGANSAIREALSAMPNTCSTVEKLDYGYKELTLPSTFQGDFALDENALHIWPRGNFMMIALPNLDRTFTCTLFLAHNGDPSFNDLQTPEQVKEFFVRNFPDIAPQMRSLRKEFADNPTGHMTTVKTDRWHFGDDVLILGDAAHAIVPFFGQGMNCGFEDCFEFDKMLKESGDDWANVLPRIAANRKLNADAIAAMAIENFVEMRDKVSDPRFVLVKEVENLLQKEFPDEYVSRYQLVSFSPVSYAFAHEVGKIQEKMLEELCAKIERPEHVDLERAGQWIRSVFTPMLKPFLV